MLSIEDIKNCEIGKKVVISSARSIINDLPVYIYFRQLEVTPADRYQLSIYTQTGNKTKKRGFLQFRIAEEENLSEFMGGQISPEYRGQGLWSYMFAHWLTFSLVNGYKRIEMYETQKKPSLVSSVKSFGFEIPGNAKLAYSLSPVTISICTREEDPKTKYLYFRTIEQARRYKGSDVYKFSSDRIIMPEELSRGDAQSEYQIVDQILLNRRYVLPDENRGIASKKIEQVFSLYK